MANLVGMKLTPIRYMLGIVVASALLSGCTVSNASRSATFVPSALSVSRGLPDSSGYRVLHSFNGRDGKYPVASLIDVNGILYGTTTGGGTRGLAPKDGVVFSITTDGAEHVLHNFGTGARDGNYPGAALNELDGTLYGTTELGNKANTGTVFSITRSGVEHVLYRFGEFGPSGMQPSAKLVDVGGTFYSTTNFGGSSNLGTVFSVAPSGKESTLYSFGQPYGSDGRYPAARLVNVHGTLYGTTYGGGAYGRGRCGPYRCSGDGSVFSITPAGKKRTLHSFGSGSDGVNPQAGLLNVNGTLYGTTFGGGKHPNCGTVFSISPAGDERVLYSFGAAGDGCGPAADLIFVHGRLYGTTGYGGAYDSKGTVFGISLTGSGERVLHSFSGGKDGANPQAALLNLGGTLYGTTQKGGTSNLGTVFALTLNDNQ
jgi:uncharacterized repeat protein (TIGR03803 family)